jgi:hypothetical protein
MNFAKGHIKYVRPGMIYKGMVFGKDTFSNQFSALFARTAGAYHPGSVGGRRCIKKTKLIIFTHNY